MSFGDFSFLCRENVLTSQFTIGRVTKCDTRFLFTKHYEIFWLWFGLFVFVLSEGPVCHNLLGYMRQEKNL